MFEGEMVVDFWGGYISKEKIDLWMDKMISVVFLLIKGVVVFCVYILVL